MQSVETAEGRVFLAEGIRSAEVLRENKVVM
jgi:hypothetical protein